MEVESNSAESSPGALTGMSRATKMFIKVDKEGFLIDSLAISDVVNFDCIESIVTSAKRIIALFTDVTQENVDITGLFYYKKRARSLRMNPVPLVTTTDGFRAVAEHPNGEIPLGVEWEKKRPKSVKAVLKNSDEKRSRSVSPASKGSETDVREKKLKLDVPAKYKTYMPAAAQETVSVTPATTTMTFDGEPPELVIRQRPEELVPTQKGGNKIDQHIPVEPTALQFIQPLTAEDIKKIHMQRLSNGDESKRNPRQTKSNYHWTEDVSCEVILTYDGISERQKLKPYLSSVIQSLVKGDFSVLRADLYHQISTEAKQSNPEMLTVNYKDNEKQKPIVYLNDAKTEIFKVLSLLCMSKARFKDLLDWMKTLKLEEGNQGKYFLSERNVIGGGLRVMYDTDEQAASKLNTLQKLRSIKAKEKTKVLYPVTPLQTALNAQKQGNFMIMVPSSTTAGTTVASTAVSNTNPILGDPLGIIPTLKPGQTLVPFTTTQMANQPHPAWSKEVLSKSSDPKTTLVSLLNTSTKSINTSSSSKSTNTESPKQTSRHPNILRSKTHFHSQKPVPPSGEPIPMHLYRSYKAGNDPKNLKIDGAELTDNDTVPVVIKQEPVEHNSDDNEDDNSKHSQEKPPDDFKGVLNTDTDMPFDFENNDLNMEIVIKTEPIDDYCS